MPRTATSRHVTVFVWPVRLIVEPESGFHSRIVPSSLPVIRNSEMVETCRHLWDRHGVSKHSQWGLEADGRGGLLGTRVCEP